MFRLLERLQLAQNLRCRTFPKMTDLVPVYLRQVQINELVIHSLAVETIQAPIPLFRFMVVSLGSQFG